MRAIAHRCWSLARHPLVQCSAATQTHASQALLLARFDAEGDCGARPRVRHTRTSSRPSASHPQLALSRSYRTPAFVCNTLTGSPLRPACMAPRSIAPSRDWLRALVVRDLAVFLAYERVGAHTQILGCARQ